VATFYVENFGCRATQADGASIERQFEQRGLARAAAPASAGLVVLNTCTVTAAADHDARAAIRRIHRQNPNCQIIVTGCYAQRAPEEIAALPGVTKVIGNSHKHLLAEISTQPRPRTSDVRPQQDQRTENFVPLSVLTPEARSLTSEVQGPGSEVRGLTPDIWVSDIFAHTELLAAPVFDAANERTRPNLKIQDGCNNRCSFCVIPSVRGRSRSLTTDRILEEVKALVAAGYQEIVLSGINLGRWGRDLAREARPATGDPRPFSGQRLAILIRTILDQTAVSKLRISSVEPMDWTDELISLVASSPRIAKHAHAPLQSGSDAVLRRMHRKYRPWNYVEKITRIRAIMPDAAIGADVMVGFPGESEAEFEETRRMVETLPFTYLHVFTYSARPGTPAASMPMQVPEPVARDRNRVLRELASAKKLAFMQSFVGKTIEAITLKNEECGAGDSAREPHTEGLTHNYLKLRLQGHHAPNRWLTAQVTGVANGSLLATPV
jgi:threonylcarbamoyladenosine tRNA methylthiotransferase MtaB